MEELLCKIIINKALSLSEKYSLSIETICKDLITKLREEYTNCSYSEMINNLKNYVTKNAKEDSIKFGLIYYLGTI